MGAVGVAHAVDRVPMAVWPRAGVAARRENPEARNAFRRSVCVSICFFALHIILLAGISINQS
jgi:hypothetical protein